MEYVYQTPEGYVIDLLDSLNKPIHAAFFEKWMNFFRNELNIFYDLSPYEFVQILNSKLERFDAYFCSDRLEPPYGNQWIIFKTLAGLTAFLLENSN